MGVYIRDMEKPKGCWDCFNWGCDHWAEHGYDNTDDCPLIEIVQCKDCKYGHKHILKDTYDCDKSDITVFHEADFFCKASERRE